MPLLHLLSVRKHDAVPADAAPSRLTDYPGIPVADDVNMQHEKDAHVRPAEVRLLAVESD